MLYCPQCGAEYREGYSVCSDCQVPLVQEHPHDYSQESVVEPGDPSKDPFCTFWIGNDERVLGELRMVLDEAQIPHKTVNREDWLLKRMDHARLQLGVPASQYERAEQVVVDAFSNQPLLRDTDGLVSEGLQKKLDFDQDAPEMELPDNPYVNTLSSAKNTGLAEDWFPEDATVQVWTGNDPQMLDMVEMSLRENEIRARSDASSEKSVYVLPQDEQRAREIVRQILEAAPPE